MFNESNDQSGTVGFLVGIIVLVFVGIGFSLIVDKRFKFSSGKADLEETVAGEKRELEGLRHQVEAFGSEFTAKSQPLSGQPAEMEKMKLAVSSSASRLVELRAQQVALTNAIRETSAAFAEYRTNFRKEARQAAAGEKLAELVSLGGKVYSDVTIRRVTSTGMEISHSQGLSSIAPRDLAVSWQDRFQWDAEEIERAPAPVVEQAGGDQPEKPVGKTLPRGRQEPVLAARKREPEVDQKLAALRNEVNEAKRRLDRAEEEVSRARSDSMSSRGKSVPGSLETWDERITRLEASSEAFRAQFLKARGRLASVSPNDPVLNRTSAE